MEPIPNSKLVIAILAGGKSSRMGTDKTTLLWRGKTLLEHAAWEGLNTGLRVIVVGQQKPTNWPYSEVNFVDDDVTGQGPMGGLASALSFADGVNILALGADMPLIESTAIQWLIDHRNSEVTVDGVVVRSQSGIEPLFSIYSSQSTKLISTCISRGIRSLQKLIELGNFLIVDAPPWIDNALLNVNTPEDWQQLQGLN